MTLNVPLYPRAASARVDVEAVAAFLNPRLRDAIQMRH
jgi:hypothetical protein